jgi:hypothetical protein
MENLIFFVIYCSFCCSCYSVILVVTVGVVVVVRLLSFGTDTVQSKLAFNLPTYASPLCDNEVDRGETIGSTRFY